MDTHREQFGVEPIRGVIESCGVDLFSSGRTQWLDPLRPRLFVTV